MRRLRTRVGFFRAQSYSNANSWLPRAQPYAESHAKSHSGANALGS